MIWKFFAGKVKCLKRKPLAGVLKENLLCKFKEYL